MPETPEEPQTLSILSERLRRRPKAKRGPMPIDIDEAIARIAFSPTIIVSHGERGTGKRVLSFPMPRALVIDAMREHGVTNTAKSAGDLGFTMVVPEYPLGYGTELLFIRALPPLTKYALRKLRKKSEHPHA